MITCYRVASAIARGRRLAQYIFERLVSAPGFVLIRHRKAQIVQLVLPRGPRTIDGVTEQFGDACEWFGFAGMKPAATQIERQTLHHHRIRTAADALHHFYEQDRMVPIMQTAAAAIPAAPAPTTTTTSAVISAPAST